ncbi:hypothetical protein [Burkholderia anthina]|uniref:hypothetical protein n=1 Tax=Burkholderia anthina TaxID=179879 RepID=UPI0037C07236
MLKYPEPTGNAAAQCANISLAPAPMSEIDLMLLRLSNLVDALDNQQSEVESRLRVVLGPEYPSAPGIPVPECSSSHGTTLAELGSRIEAVISRNGEMLGRLAI